jgi:hypothetical protein
VARPLRTSLSAASPSDNRQPERFTTMTMD